METVHLGMIAATDPVAHFLAHDVLERVLGVHTGPVPFDVFQLDQRAVVLRYTEPQSAISVVGKFFARKVLLDGGRLPAERGERLMEREFAHMQLVQSLGFDRPPFRVARPLAVNAALDALLVAEYVPGEDLTATIKAALAGNGLECLRARLDAVAGMLAMLHQRSCKHQPVNAEAGPDYLAKVIDQLARQGIVSAGQQEGLHAQCAAWRRTGLLAAAEAVLVHGDATPSNLLFTGDDQVIAIDLERLRFADGAVDLGCVAAELKHWFFCATADPWAGEWAIAHFYAAYARQAGLDSAAFAQLTRRGQFYMGSFLLRICRNDWLEWEYRRRLAAEAEACLRL